MKKWRHDSSSSRILCLLFLCIWRKIITQSNYTQRCNWCLFIYLFTDLPLKTYKTSRFDITKEQRRLGWKCHTEISSPITGFQINSDVPTFFVRMLGKLLEFTGIEYAIQDGGSPFKRAVDHFSPGRVKKSGCMKMSLFNVQLHLSMIFPVW